MARATQYHHGDLRQAVLDRTIQVITATGVEAVSLRGLARDIGVSHPALLRHFKGRADLLATLARTGVEALIDAAAAQADATDATGLERLRILSAGYVGWARSNPAHHLVLRNHDVTRHADDGLRDRLREYADLQRSAIRQAQADGWNPDLPPETVLVQVTAFTAGLAMVATDPLYVAALGSAPGDQTLDTAINAFFHT